MTTPLGSRVVRVALALVTAVSGAVGLACSTDTASTEAGGDPDRGRELAADRGCASCHRIPGVRGADGNVGPPLDGIADRVYIAGKLTNTPENMIEFLQHTQRVRPGGAMPDVGLSETEARDLTAFLSTLSG